MGIFDDLDEMPSHSTTSDGEPLGAKEFDPSAPPEGMHREICKKCAGSGRFGTYRSLGACFACDGKGFKLYRTDATTRAKSRAQVAVRKARVASVWQDANPDAWAWIVQRAPSFSFAAAMSEVVVKYGHLTERQLAAVQKCMASDAVRAVTRMAEAQRREAEAPTVNISALETAMTKAAEGGKRPILRVATFKFSFAPATGKNAGAIYVKSTGGEYLGKVQGGRVFRSRECSAETEAAIVAAAADPKGAAIAYGREFGSCACCGKELTNKISIALGIGPVCASKFGW